MRAEPAHQSQVGLVWFCQVACRKWERWHFSVDTWQKLGQYPKMSGMNYIFWIDMYMPVGSDGWQFQRWTVSPKTPIEGCGPVDACSCSTRNDQAGRGGHNKSLGTWSTSTLTRIFQLYWNHRSSRNFKNSLWQDDHVCVVHNIYGVVIDVILVNFVIITWFCTVQPASLHHLFCRRLVERLVKDCGADVNSKVTRQCEPFFCWSYRKVVTTVSESCIMIILLFDLLCVSVILYLFTVYRYAVFTCTSPVWQ